MQVLDWSAIRRYLPMDLEEIARETGAMSRKRGVESAEDLAHLLLMCGLPNASMARVSDWARQAGVANMNPSAVFFRLRDGEAFLKAMLSEVLAQAMPCQPPKLPWRLLAVDATAVCGPGSKGTDSRVHVVYDIGAFVPLSVELTGPEGGEGFGRHRSFGAGDLLLGDRGYAYRRSILSALSSGAHILVRFEFASMRLLGEDGLPLRPAEAAARVPDTGVVDIPVLLPGWDAPLRAIGERNPQGQPVWLLTDLAESEIPATGAREIYRLRWQVELFFKRAKSLMRMDRLPSRDGPTTRPWLLAKLLLAALAILVRDERFSPWGIGLEDIRQGGLDSVREPAPSRRPEALERPGQKSRKTTQGSTPTLLLEA